MAAMVFILRLAAITNLLWAAVAAGAGPNVVVILTDDQGYGDLSCHGNPLVKTPCLDRLRAESTAFDRFFVSPTCSPTRAALLTGLHEFRTGVSHTISGRSLLGRGIPTVAEAFRAAGYRTGIVGKWHLGEAWPCRPEDRGFDDVFVHGGGGIGQTPDFWGNGYSDPMIRRKGGWEKTKGYCTDVFFAEAASWLRERAKAKQPFFLWLATNAPHAPHVPPPGGGVERLRAAGAGEQAAAFYAMIENIDTNTGRLLAALEETGLARDTVVVFLTDNGSSVAAWDAGMRGKKGSPREGGTRVPCFVRWPGKVAAGRLIEEPAAHVDVLPTLAGLCGVKLPDGWQGDGVDLSRVLTGDGAMPGGRVLVTHVGRWPGDVRPERWRSKEFSVRDARWRLTGLELCDMSVDPGERHNVFEAHPEVVERLLGAYAVWWESVLPVVRQPVRYGVGSDMQRVTRLTAHDWWPSREGAESGAARCVSHESLRGVLADWHAGGERARSVCGQWKLQCEREGSYRVRMWAVPPEAAEADRKGIGLLERGMARVRAGRREAAGGLAAGARGAELRIDLDAGPFDLEGWFERADLKDRRLGAFFVEVEREGERRTPRIELDLKPGGSGNR